jgi:chromosome segregation ATPase
MKEKPPRRTSKSAREAAEKELAGLLPTLESVAAEPEEKQDAMKRSADRARVEKTMAYTVERVTREIGDLQLSVSRMLTDLSQQLREESGKLAEIRLAIDTENSRLRELHDIDGAMVSLKAILEVAAERRAALEAELNQREADLHSAMEAKNEDWSREQADHDARTKKGREREEEEYAYKLSLKRRKEADDYAGQQSALQKSLQEQRAKADQEIGDRQRTMATREAEMKDLQMRVDRFPQELAAATKQAEQAARSEAQKQAALDAKLVKMETEAERNITSLKIAGLEDLVKRQAAQLETLTKQLSAAQAQVQAMAVKAIEGAAGMKSTVGQ